MAAGCGREWHGEVQEDQVRGGNGRAGKKRLGFELEFWEGSCRPAGRTPSHHGALVELSLPLPCPPRDPISFAFQMLSPRQSQTHGPLASLYASSVEFETHFVSPLLPCVPDCPGGSILSRLFLCPWHPAHAWHTGCAQLVPLSEWR